MINLLRLISGAVTAPAPVAGNGCKTPLARNGTAQASPDRREASR